MKFMTLMPEKITNRDIILTILCFIGIGSYFFYDLYFAADKETDTSTIILERFERDYEDIGPLPWESIEIDCKKYDAFKNWSLFTFDKDSLAPKSYWNRIKLDIISTRHDVAALPDMLILFTKEDKRSFLNKIPRNKLLRINFKNILFESRCLHLIDSVTIATESEIEFFNQKHPFPANKSLIKQFD